VRETKETRQQESRQEQQRLLAELLTIYKDATDKEAPKAEAGNRITSLVKGWRKDNQLTTNFVANKILKAPVENLVDFEKGLVRSLTAQTLLPLFQLMALDRSELKRAIVLRKSQEPAKILKRIRRRRR